MNSFSKGGVYGTRKTGQALHGAEDRHVAPLEGLAAWHQRKYQRVTEIILPQENRLVRLLSRRSQQGSSAPQSTPATNFGLSNSGK